MNARGALVVVHVDAACGRRRRSASAIGVEREPGHTTASVTPAAHPLVDERGAEGGVGRRAGGSRGRAVGVGSARRAAYGRGRSEPYAAAVTTGSDRCTPRSPAHRPPPGAGPRLHPDPALLGPLRRPTSPPTTRSCWSTLPGHGGSADVAADLRHAAPAARRAPAGPATYVGYSLGGRLCLHLALARPDLVAGLVLIGATAGIDDADERAARRGRPTRRWPTASSAIGVDAVPRGVARPAAVRRPAAAAPARRRARWRTPPTGLAGEPAPGRHRHPGAAVGPAGELSTCRCCGRRRATTPSSRRSPTPGRHRADATVALVPGRHTAHLETATRRRSSPLAPRPSPARPTRSPRSPAARAARGHRLAPTRCGGRPATERRGQALRKRPTASSTPIDQLHPTGGARAPG